MLLYVSRERSHVAHMDLSGRVRQESGKTCVGSRKLKSKMQMRMNIKIIIYNYYVMKIKCIN